MDDHETGRKSKPSQVPLLARRWVRMTLTGVLALVALTLALVVGAGIWTYRYLSELKQTLPDVSRLDKLKHAEPSILRSASGGHLASFSHGYFDRITLDEISPYVINALIATEDHRFHEHKGVDFERTAGAAWYTLRGYQQGGSTITQQLARNAFPQRVGRARTLERKLREMLTALEIEKVYGKEEILEIYLNSVPFLYQVTGIEMAARTYFNKSARDLDVLESATLVGMLKGTSYYNPVLQPERAERRRNVVLARMRHHGMLDTASYERLRRQPLEVKLTLQPNPLGPAPHFAAHVRREAQAWASQHGYDLNLDGLVIHSTLDERLQEVATDAVERQARVLQDIADVEWAQRDNRLASRTPAAYAKLRKSVEPFSRFWEARPGLLQAFVRESHEFRRAVEGGASEAEALERLMADETFLDRLRAAKTRLEAGFVAIDPRSGEVKAWVGSRDFAQDQFDHVAQAARQPGSTFKPFVYGAALENGLQPELLYPDGEIEIYLDDGKVWKPGNMTGFSGRMMTMREGLVFSKNTITAQVMQDVGLQQVMELARAAGIRTSRLRAVPSLSLGTSPVTLLEMVSGYATIAQIGEYRAPRTITRIEDREGRVLARFDSRPELVMSEDTAVELIDMLRNALRMGTGVGLGQRFKVAADVAGKTGTTQYNTDGWFILMHPQLVAGAWVGFNDQRVTMRSDYWGQGGRNAVLLVGDFFQRVLKGRMIDASLRFPESQLPPPLMVRGPIAEDARVVQGIDLIPPEGHGMVVGGDRALRITPEGSYPVERIGGAGSVPGPWDSGNSSGAPPAGSGAAGGATRLMPRRLPARKRQPADAS